jgi:gluconolactonase
VSPDQKTLYVISNDNGYFDFQRLKEGETTAQGHHMLQAYDLAEDGSVSNRRVLVDYHPYSGPDGMIAALGADFGGRMLVKTDMATGKTYILSGLYDGRPYNALNDISIDEQGRIYFSDPRYLGHEPVYQPGYAVYRLDPDGTVHRIITDGGKTNGVLVSPDQKTLYVVSNDNGWFDFQRLKEGEAAPSQGHHVLQAYDLADDGTVSNRRVLVDYAPYSGPDGMVADVEGNLYVALRAENRPGIGVFNAEGKELAFISTGEELPTNVGFGRGDESNVLYVTSGKSLYKIPMAKDGYQLPSTN